MNPKQQEKIQGTIKKLKAALAADKKKWNGYYHDGKGYRYLIPELYLQLNDYKDAQRYFNWFAKNFEGDIGYPIFLFEWSITLVKNGKLKDAENKVIQTFASNTYLLDYFLDKESLEFQKNESSNWESKETLTYFKYKKEDPELIDFVDWLEKFMKSERFLDMANEFIEIQIKVKDLPVGKERTNLFNRERRLLKKFS